MEGRIRKRELKKEEDECGGHRRGVCCLCCSGLGRGQSGAGDSQEQEITEERGQKCRPSKGREEGREDGDKIAGRVT